MKWVLKVISNSDAIQDAVERKCSKERDILKVVGVYEQIAYLNHSSKSRTGFFLQDISLNHRNFCYNRADFSYLKDYIIVHTYITVLYVLVLCRQGASPCFLNQYQLILRISFLPYRIIIRIMIFCDH